MIFITLIFNDKKSQLLSKVAINIQLFKLK